MNGVLLTTLLFPCGIYIRLPRAAEKRLAAPARMMIGVEEEVPGGLWHTKTPEQQESILTLELYKIIHVISKRDIPIALLCFPRLVADPEYLFRKLEFMLNGIGYHGFLAAFKQTARPELVHDFGTSEETNAEKNG